MPAGGNAPDWTFEEELQIIRHYPQGKTLACLPHLPNRNKHAIRQHAYKMKHAGRLSPRKFGVREDDLPY